MLWSKWESAFRICDFTGMTIGNIKKKIIYIQIAVPSVSGYLCSVGHCENFLTRECINKCRKLQSTFYHNIPMCPWTALCHPYFRIIRSSLTLYYPYILWVFYAHYPYAVLQIFIYMIPVITCYTVNIFFRIVSPFNHNVYILPLESLLCPIYHCSQLGP